MASVAEASERRDDRYVADVADAAGVLNLANARLVAIVEGVLTDESWMGGGIHSPKQWVAYRAGVSPERAEVIVRIAERRSSFPHVIAAFDAGELSLEQVAELVKAPAWADPKILDWGRIATVARLRRTMRTTWFTEPADGDAGITADDGASASDTDNMATSVTADHRWQIRGALDLGRGGIVDAALIEAREILFQGGQTSISTADCLVEVCRRYLDGIESPTRRERSMTWVHIDVADGTASRPDGWHLPDTVRDRICCDGSVQPVWERDGIPFSVGRSQRIVPERTRRIIERRDQGCRVPGCSNHRFVEIHHIVHWLHGGRTDTDNLISLCGRHHRIHHQGSLGITGDADHADGIEFTDAHGTRLDPCGRPRPPTAGPPKPATRYEPPLIGRVDYTYVGLGWAHPDELARRRARHSDN